MNKEERVIKLVEILDDTFEIRTFLDHDPSIFKSLFQKP